MNNLNEKICIYEDSQREVKLEKDEKEFLEALKKQHVFTYNEKLSFNIKHIGDEDYFEPNGCVGLVKSPKRTITVLPRFGNLDFNNVLRMWMYSKSSQQLDKAELISSFSFDYNKLLPDLAEKLLTGIDEIVRNGLVGSYVEESDSVMSIKGKIDVGRSLQQFAIKRHVYCEYQNLSIDNILNQIILYCMNHLRVLQSNDLTLEINRLSAFFSTVTLRQNITYSDFYQAWSKVSRLTPIYGKVLRLCEMLVFNTFLSNFDGTNAWYGFLIDYNYLFEDYIRKLLINKLGLNVGKWEKPKSFGNWIDNGLSREKSYLPDIVIDYNENSNRCKCVLDVKNKPIENIFSNPDIFQLIFYCLKLQTRIGILIYPSVKPHDLSRIEIKLPSINDKFVLFGVYHVLPSSAEEFWMAQERFVETVSTLAVK